MLDQACQIFTKSFYTACLTGHKTVCQAFEIAKESIRAIDTLPKGEENKFLLLKPPLPLFQEHCCNPILPPSSLFLSSTNVPSSSFLSHLNDDKKKNRGSEEQEVLVGDAAVGGREGVLGKGEGKVGGNIEIHELGEEAAREEEIGAREKGRGKEEEGNEHNPPISEGRFLDLTPGNDFPNLPCETENFLGRNEAMHDLLVLISSNRFITIKGLPGIGKSSLLKHLARFLWERKVFK